MTTTDRDALRARIEAAQQRLRDAIQKLPFDINKAGATRVLAWKAACTKAHQLLSRAPANEDAYNEALRNVQQCAVAPPAVLAIEMHGSDAEKARLAAGAQA